MTRQNRIHNQLQETLKPEFLALENESHMHNVPVGSETHFKVLVVSSQFQDQNRVARQRLVNQALASEFNSGLHALTQMTLTPEEYDLKKDSLNFISPECMGGSKK